MTREWLGSKLERRNAARHLAVASSVVVSWLLNSVRRRLLIDNPVNRLPGCARSLNRVQPRFNIPVTCLGSSVRRWVPTKLTVNFRTLFSIGSSLDRVP